jgi:heptosyltransferase-1
MQFGLQSLYSISTTPHSNSKERVVLITGTSRLDKAWPIDNWIELARRLHSNALEVCLVHGNDTEEAFAKQVQLEVPDVVIWPRLELSALALQMKECIGSIGVDSGPSHLSVALGMTHVQIYNFPTAWRTGPSNSSHQISVYHKPTPSVQEVWDGWQRVQSSPRHFESTFEH